MRYSPLLITATALLFTAGCAGTQVASLPATTNEHTVARHPTSESTDREFVTTAKPESAAKSTAVEQASHWQPSSGDSLLPAPAAAISDAAGTTLDSLEQLALSSNPTLVEMQARVDAANGRWVQVGLNPNPVAGVSSQEIGNDGSAGQHGVFVGQEYVTADKLDLNRNAASWAVKRAEQEQAAQQLRVLTDVRRGFYATRIAQERVKIAEELQGIAQAAVEKATELVKVQEPLTGRCKTILPVKWDAEMSISWVSY